MRNFFIKSWKLLKRLFWTLLIGQFIYIIVLKWVDPPFTLTQLGSFFSGNGLKRDYISKEEMPPLAGLAVIASEDQLFPTHNGFDWKSIRKAMEKNQQSKRIAGGSTISQQVAKNVFLWQGRTWLRKGLETYFTFMIEWIWGKERILEMYLNVAEMGKGVFGIEAASQHFFNKPASKLTRTQAAMIAASLPNPVRYTINPLSKYINARYPWVLLQMNNLEGAPDIQRVLPGPKKKPSAPEKGK